MSSERLLRDGGKSSESTSTRVCVRMGHFASYMRGSLEARRNRRAASESGGRTGALPAGTGRFRSFTTSAMEDGGAGARLRASVLSAVMAAVEEDSSIADVDCILPEVVS